MEFQKCSIKDSSVVRIDSGLRDSDDERSQVRFQAGFADQSEQKCSLPVMDIATDITIWSRWMDRISICEASLW